MTDSWYWRTKPRSALKVIEWFPYFAELERQDWDLISSTVEGRPVHPTRRKYTFLAHNTESDYLTLIGYEDFLSGKYDRNEAEGDSRNDKTTFEFFGLGYVDNQGIVRTTKVGSLILAKNFNNEDFLKQLLKISFHNQIDKFRSWDQDQYIFPMEILLHAIKRYKYLNRCEVALLFGCCNKDQFKTALDAIQVFRNKYNSGESKSKKSYLKNLFREVYVGAYENIKNKPETYFDYAEAFCRSLAYTGLFELTGRSLNTKLRVREFAQEKITLLFNEYEFKNSWIDSSTSYLDWLGDPVSTHLPWENEAQQAKILKSEFEYLKKRERELGISISNKESKSDLITERYFQGKNIRIEDAINQVEEQITNLHENNYKERIAKTSKNRDEVLMRFEEIRQNKIDDAALWLEVNTWKSLLAINGKHDVKRNFKLNPDLTPRSFAPGAGNTPDMLLTWKKKTLIVEVSMMRGVQQWEHEGSSVPDHLIAYSEDHPEEQTTGLFLAPTINERTQWQFMILQHESWLGRPIIITPLRIDQYYALVEHLYKRNKNVEDLFQILETINKKALNSSDYHGWIAKTELLIDGLAN